jgi:regulator of replication initiation timing
MGDADIDVETRLAQLERQLDGMLDFVEQTDERADRLEAENESLRQEVAELRGELREVKQFTDLLSPDEDVSKSKKTRAAIALRTLYNTATNTNGIHAMDAEAVADANQGEIQRSWGFQVMQEIPDLVGDEEVCWIADGVEGGDNTRAVLDLRKRNDAAAAVPGTSQGVPIRSEVAADD